MPEAALATASVPGVGTGSSAASPVETSPISAPSETVETPDIGVETAEPIAGEQPTESVSTDSPETQETQDGRVIPQEFREAFKQNPKLRNLFFSEKAYREQFPTIQEARQARDLLETVGGEEGWKQVQQSQEEQRGLDDLYYSRNPQKQRDFVKNLLTQDKGAFESIVPVALEEFYGASPEAYNRVMSQVISSTFQMSFNRAGLAGALAQLKNSIGANDGRATQILQGIEEWAGEFEKIARSKPAIDPEREKLQKELDEIKSSTEKQKQDSFFSSYQSDAYKSAETSVEKHLASMLAGKTLDKDTKETLSENIVRRVSRMAQKDENYMRSIKAILQRGDKDKAVRFFTSKFNQLLPQAAKEVFKAFNVNPNPKPAPTNTAAKPAVSSAPQSPGFVRIARAPKSSEIDYSRTSNKMIANGQAVLIAGGKKVQWE